MADKRQRRKRRQAERRATRGAVAERYERGREKDEQVRRSLEPLAEGERPTAVTVGAIVAVGLAVAELIAFAVSFDSDEANRAVRTAVVVPLLLFIAWGMWRAKYYAVLGMQTLLALTIIFSAVALTGAGNLRAVVLVVVIVAAAGTLFWFLVRAMARIQMPERPGASR